MIDKQPLPAILDQLSDLPSDHVTGAYDTLKFEAYDIELVYAAA